MRRSIQFRRLELRWVLIRLRSMRLDECNVECATLRTPFVHPSILIFVLPQYLLSLLCLPWHPNYKPLVLLICSIAPTPGPRRPPDLNQQSCLHRESLRLSASLSPSSHAPSSTTLIPQHPGPLKRFVIVSFRSLICPPQTADDRPLRRRRGACGKIWCYAYARSCRALHALEGCAQVGAAPLNPVVVVQHPHRAPNTSAER